MIARYFTSLENGRVQCNLCPHECIIADKRAGKCRVRVNHGGVLHAESYGMLSAINVDPVEKKPLYHFHPGKMIYSIGSFGCNFICPCCQNFEISQSEGGTLSRFDKHSVKRILEEAQEIPENIGVAYTYNEPLIGYEFVQETAGVMKNAGLKNVVVSNSYLSPQPLRSSRSAQKIYGR